MKSNFNYKIQMSRDEYFENMSGLALSLQLRFLKRILPS